MNVRFEMGHTLMKSERSEPGVLKTGVIVAVLKVWVTVPVEK